MVKDYSIRDIRNYIVENYKDSCLAYNDRHGIMSDEELLTECEDFFYYEVLKWCGCGDPALAKRCVRDYMNIIFSWQKDTKFDVQKSLNDRFGVEVVYDNELLLCLAYALSAADLTEHGTSIGFSWLTDEGQMFLSLLNMDEELSGDNDECYAHGLRDDVDL